MSIDLAKLTREAADYLYGGKTLRRVVQHIADTVIGDMAKRGLDLPEYAPTEESPMVNIPRLGVEIAIPDGFERVKDGPMQPGDIILIVAQDYGPEWRHWVRLSEHERAEHKYAVARRPVVEPKTCATCKHFNHGDCWILGLSSLNETFGCNLWKGKP